MGSGNALELALAAPDLKAVSINSGALATDKDQLARIHAAVLGNLDIALKMQPMRKPGLPGFFEKNLGH